MRGTRQSATFEFHVARSARQRYSFDEALFGLTGNVVFADFAAAGRFAQHINDKRNIAADPAAAVRAGDLNAMGLVDEVLHYVVAMYREERNPEAMTGALQWLEMRLTPQGLDRTLEAFVDEFPNVAAYRGDVSAREYLDGTTNGIPNREIALEELLMVWLANGNPAFAPYGELFDDRNLEDGSAYIALVRGLEAYFKTQPTFGPDNDDLIALLRRPALEASGSLTDQLRWMRERWGFVAERYSDRLVISLDVLSEEDRAVWMRFHPAGTQADGGRQEDSGDADSAALHGFSSLFSGDAEVERFSQDLDWMPRVVLLAKSTYVWLDQLSRQYARPIWRLDQIPDDELDRLQRAGFTGLWLIGLWERSQASRTIKQMRGNPEAVASAYSLMDYRIAEDLGGDEAYRNLRDRAWSRGVRLASDMVPNHMGIDSRWVTEHPDWFMSRPDAPYPAYQYSGVNLSADPRVGVYLEDHYFDNTDAAVTFKRVDHWSGEGRYIYHGNDGTSMPWNDTAQLDYLKPEVREAVIQTILHVARQFPIIRFDAAMTLAKRHIARLWYPEPGAGGAIPSRAEFAMKKADFDRAMPIEFWREVVDRVAAEAPDTLLLAEAFWLMEGYFVRTLGMHRVYNSAFMNMMRDEKNAEYRLVIKNTLEFDPQILKRYVNFMNNPDERTAVDQFGKGDKYFGVATVLATMPGLPMFGHGQIEGYAERYGMEYRRAYLDEAPDTELIARHEREIFPLVHQRWLFAEVDNFALYDFVTDAGAVNDNVFAFSNLRDGHRSFVVYNNKFADTSGSIRSAAVTGASFGEGLALSDGADDWLVMRDGRSGLEYLRSQRDLARNGLHLTLHAYETQVYTELRDVRDTDGRYGRLAQWLEGRGVPSVEDALRELDLQPLHDALRRGDQQAALREAAALVAAQPPTEQAKPEKTEKAQPSVIARAIETLVGAQRPDLARGKWVYEWLVDRVWSNADLISLQLDIAARPKNGRNGATTTTDLLKDDRFRRAIGVNVADGVTWFDRDRFAEAVTVLALPDAAGLTAAAAKSHYRIDDLARLVGEAPAWSSTRPAKPAPRQRATPHARTASSVAKKLVADGADKKSVKPTKK
jgi:glycosidase